MTPKVRIVEAYCDHFYSMTIWHNTNRQPNFVLFVAELGQVDLMLNPCLQHQLGKMTINQASLLVLDIACLLSDEQTEIVRRVESLFAYADRLEARYTAARAQVEKLTPALLAKAFRGELVPQDPSDEPAGELLARIAAARETTATVRTRKPTTRKTYVPPRKTPP